jgi:molybdenum cofactor synthesis domain-containing protein
LSWDKPFTKLVPRLEAARIIDENVNQINRVEEVRLDEAAGRVLAADLVAHGNIPPFDRSSMDGYALRAADTHGASESKPKQLKLLGAGYAGEPFAGIVGDGECIEIATGSPLPKGADSVIMVEYTKLAGNIVEIMRAAKPDDNIEHEGEDIKTGEIVVKAGDVLTAGKIGAAAALGVTSLKVYAKPTVALYSTGNEIVPQGKPLGPSQVYDINTHTLASIVQASGCVALRRGLVPDDTQIMLMTLKEAGNYDAVVFSGGSSVGSRDFFAQVVEQVGTVHFHGLQVKPGKPTLFGTVHGTPVFGMPGNSTSCLSNAYIFLIPMLRKMARLPAVETKTVEAKLSRLVESDGEREVFYTVRLENGEAVPVFKRSSNITSMAHADGMIIIPAKTKRLEAGSKVNVYLFS